MKEETMLEVFRIARDVAVANHEHQVKRSDMAKAMSNLGRGMASDDSPRQEPPSTQALFEESYRFMASELSTLKNAGHAASEKNEP